MQRDGVTSGDGKERRHVLMVHSWSSGSTERVVCVSEVSVHTMKLRNPFVKGCVSVKYFHPPALRFLPH